MINAGTGMAGRAGVSSRCSGRHWLVLQLWTGGFDVGDGEAIE